MNMKPQHDLQYDVNTEVFTLTTTELDHGQLIEHIEMFTAPRTTAVFNVLGVDCIEMRRLFD